MNGWVIFTLAIAPGLFLLWFFYKKDNLEPEPRHLIIKTFFWGVLLAIPIVFIQIPFTLFVPAFLLYTVVAPITEEYGKYFVVRRGVYKDKEFDEPMDGIVYAAAAALGFASIENVGYLMGAYTEGGTEGVLTLSVIRGLLSVPGHALWSSFWGYALGMAKFQSPDRAKRLIRNGLALSMFGHGLFNGLLIIHPALALGVLILIPVMWRLLFRRIASALAASPHAVRQPSDRPRRF